jgi:hypothetical protein
MSRPGLQRAGLAFLVTLAVWLAVFWPLPRHVFRAIPFSHQPETHRVRAMVSGDHLQLLYHFWLAHDMLAGRTPLFYNLYEFNTGSDAERWAPDAYYAPFSLVYAAGAALAGPAFGWNLAGFVSLWLGYLLTWLLARRFSESDAVAAAAALVGLLLPFRLVTLFAGSPTGFAVAWIPLTAWGLDRAIRDDSRAGGCWAGLGILLAALGDLHVFYFSLLSLPGWAWLASVRRPAFAWREGRAWRRLGQALLPLAVLAGLAVLLTLEAGRGVEASVMAGGRTEREVLLFTPDARGFFQDTDHAPNAFIFVGLALPALLAAGLLAAAAFRVRQGRTDGGRLAALIVAAAGVLLAAALALGPRGPFEGGLFAACRAWVPKFDMIRQSSKIFALMPALLAAASALGLEALRAFRLPQAVRVGLPALLAAALLMAYAPRSAPSLCRLDREQGAYAAVAEDAVRAGRPAHALAVPLWPGDAHDSSLYQYYASLYRIRLVNGYSPKVGRAYVETIFQRFESVNAGCLDDGQIADLLARGVRYLVLHEDQFPDKASPFPVAFTIRRFLNHPRLRLLARDRRVWAFRLFDEPETRPEVWPEWTVFFPARAWDAASPPAARTHVRLFGPAETLEDAGSWAGRVARLAAPGAALETRGVGAPSGSGLRWLVRVRGDGALAAACRVDGALRPSHERLAVASPDWTWLELPLPCLTNFSVVSLRLEHVAGAVDWDTARLLGGAWTPPAPGETVSWPPALFFHAGYLDEATGAVRFEADYDREGVVLYGPKLPLEPGRYRLELAHESPAGRGTILGRVNVQWRERAEPAWTDVVAGQPTIVAFEQRDNLPFFVVLLFLRESDMELRQVRLIRLE